MKPLSERVGSGEFLDGVAIPSVAFLQRQLASEIAELEAKLAEAEKDAERIEEQQEEIRRLREVLAKIHSSHYGKVFTVLNMLEDEETTASDHTDGVPK